MRWLDSSTTDSVYMNLSKLRETVKDRGAWSAVVHRVTQGWILVSDRVTTVELYCVHNFYLIHFVTLDIIFMITIFLTF